MRAAKLLKGEQVDNVQSNNQGAQGANPSIRTVNFKSGSQVYRVPISKHSKLGQLGYGAVDVYKGDQRTWALVPTDQSQPRRGLDNLRDNITDVFDEPDLNEDGKNVGKTGNDLKREAVQLYDNLSAEGNPDAEQAFIQYIERVVYPVELLSRNLLNQQAGVVDRNVLADSELRVKPVGEERHIQNITPEIQQVLRQHEKEISFKRFFDLFKVSKQSKEILRKIEELKTDPFEEKSESNDSEIRRNLLNKINERISEIDERIATENFKGEKNSDGHEKAQYIAYNDNKAELSTAETLFSEPSENSLTFDDIVTIIELKKDEKFGCNPTNRPQTVQENKLHEKLQEFENNPLKKGLQEDISAALTAVNNERSAIAQQSKEVVGQLQSCLDCMTPFQDHYSGIDKDRSGEDLIFYEAGDTYSTPLNQQLHAITGGASTEWQGKLLSVPEIDHTEVRKRVTDAMSNCAETILRYGNLVDQEALREALARCFVSSGEGAIDTSVSANLKTLEKGFCDGELSLDKNSLLLLNNYARYAQLGFQDRAIDQRLVFCKGLIHASSSDKKGEFEAQYQALDAKYKSLIEEVKEKKIQNLTTQPEEASTDELVAGIAAKWQEEYQELAQRYFELSASIEVLNKAALQAPPTVKAADWKKDWDELCSVIKFASPYIDSTAGARIANIFAETDHETVDHTVELREALREISVGKTGIYEFEYEEKPTAVTLKTRFLTKRIIDPIAFLLGAQKSLDELDSPDNVKDALTAHLETLGVGNTIASLQEKLDSFNFEPVEESITVIENQVSELIDKKEKVLQAVKDFALMSELQKYITQAKESAEYRNVSSSKIDRLCNTVEDELFACLTNGELTNDVTAKCKDLVRTLTILGEKTTIYTGIEDLSEEEEDDFQDPNTSNESTDETGSNGTLNEGSLNILLRSNSQSSMGTESDRRSGTPDSEGSVRSFSGSSDPGSFQSISNGAVASRKKHKAQKRQESLHIGPLGRAESPSLIGRVAGYLKPWVPQFLRYSTSQTAESAPIEDRAARYHAAPHSIQPDGDDSAVRSSDSFETAVAVQGVIDGMLN